MRDRWILAGYLVALIVFGLVAGGGALYFQKYDRQAAWVWQTETGIAELESTLGDLRDSETGQRGFLLTGMEEFLEPFESGVTDVPVHLQNIASLTAENPAQQRRIQALRPLVEAKLDFARSTIAAYKRGDRQRAMSMVASREGKRLMDAIRRVIAAMEHEERRLLQERMARAQTTAWRAGALILFGNGFAFALLCASTILVGRELLRRKAMSEQLALHQQREELLARSEALKRRLESVLDEIPVGVVLVRAGSGELVFNNRHMIELYGGPLPVKNLIEEYRVLEVARADGTPYSSDERPIVRVLNGGAPVSAERIQLTRADGSVMDVVVSVAPLRDHQGRVEAVVAAFEDYSEAKRSEEARQEAERLRGVLLGAIGHDLRNPLSVIATGVGTLSRRDLPPAAMKVVARMSSSADRMSRMVDQLLDVTNVRLGGGIQIQRQRVDMGELVRRAVERLEVANPERTITLALDGDMIGDWDPDRTTQVVTELLLNALEHGAPVAPVQVTVRGVENGIDLEVNNRGNPIPEELRPLIFDPFRRAAERRRTKTGGLGVGLYVALQIVRLHGGAMEAESSPEAGTTFRVHLPR